MIRVDALFTMASRNPPAFLAGLRYGHRWCHLFADTPEELPALHALAQGIGMLREWCDERPGRLVHYDLLPPRREAALRAGAVEGTDTELIEALHRFREAARRAGD